MRVPKEREKGELVIMKLVVGRGSEDRRLRRRCVREEIQRRRSNFQWETVFQGLISTFTASLSLIGLKRYAST